MYIGQINPAEKDGWLFDSQARHLSEIKDGKFFTLERHAGIWSDFLLLNPTFSYVVSMHPEIGSAQLFVIVLLITTMATFFIVRIWIADPVPSAYTRDGKPTLPAMGHALYMPPVLSVFVMYYLSAEPKNKLEVTIITFVLMVHWAIGLCQPPLVVHGTIHTQAKILSLAGIIVFVAVGTIKIIVS
ncbi:MAG: hypothetical protein JWO50_345 [Candidatus Kaiserbacteria bacterium]|nr:hypothetical protein [Candidatus Kaiserbacteria bacterium]